MREIKYKSLYRGIWYQVSEMGLSNGNIYPTQFEGENFSPDLEHVKCTVEYTGLKDKNGVEIYERDICVCNGSLTIVSYPYGGSHRLYTNEKVFITSELCGFCGRHISSFGKDLSPSSFFEGWETISNYSLWNNQRGLTVIGNIYQNPELLK